MDGKIVRREDARCYDNAKRVLRAAQKEGVRMINAARGEIEQQRLAGYGEGVRDGRRELARVFADAILRRDVYFANAEQEVCNLVIAGVRKIFAEFDDAEKTRIAVRKALSALRSHTQAVIRVNPSQYESVRQDLSHVTALFPNLSMLTIEPDGTVPDTACIMSSDLGTVETDIETQIEALEIALARAMASRQSMPAGPSGSELAFIDSLAFDDGDADALLAKLIGKTTPETEAGEQKCE
jgi:type III secretion protein L